MTSIKNFPSTYHDISWSQLYHLKSTSKKILSGPIAQANVQKDISDWQAVANRLNQSIRSNPPFYRCLLDIVTLHILKKWALRLMLPGIMSETATKVNQIALYRLGRAPGANPPPAPNFNRPPGPQNPAPVPPLPGKIPTQKNLNACLATIQKANKYFQDNKAALLANLPSQQDKDDTEKQVNVYFADKADLIHLHNTVPALPRWYHATRSTQVAAKILSDSTLVQSTAASAPAGAGVYFSTQHERSSYGNFCFALDQDMIHPMQNVTYFPPVSRGIFSEKDSNPIWIRVQHDVAVAWDGVAHIVVGSEQEEQNMRKHLNPLSQQAAIASTVPFIYPPTQKILAKCFQEAYGRAQIPNHWQRHPWAPPSGQNLWQPPLGNPRMPDPFPYVEQPHHMHTRAPF